MRKPWMSGLENTRRALKRRARLAMPPEGMGVVVHDVLPERITDAPRKPICKTAPGFAEPEPL